MGTIISDVFNPETLTDTVQGAFAQKNALMGSRLASLGMVVVNDEMPEGGPEAIGTSVKVPRFSNIGDFTNNPDGSSLTPATLKQTSETATVTRDSLGFEVSRWASGNSALMPGRPDPYEEATRQIMVAAERAMDARCITAASAAGVYVKDVYSSTVPKTIDYDLVVDTKFQGWGDEASDDLAGIVVHSQAQKDLLKLKSSVGTLLLATNMTNNGPVTMLADLPVVVSDRVPVTGSAMGAVSSSGSTPPVATITGTPLGAFNLVVDCTLGGAHATATVRFSTDGGSTWSNSIVTATATTPFALTDTAIDSVVGVQGRTGLSIAFAAGTFNADNLWTATASMKVMTLLVKKGALAFWYNRQAMELETDKNIRSHSREAAMHLYAAAHRYTRPKATSTHPGVIQLTHNVSGF